MLQDSYSELIARNKQGNRCVMLTYLRFDSPKRGSIEKKLVITYEDVKTRIVSLNDDLYDNISISLETGKLQLIGISENKAVLVEPFFPKSRLIVFGGGHISKPLTEFAARVGFSVTVIDDRPSFANTIRFPEAERVICESFEKSFELINLKKSDFVVIVTRGHRYDGLVLREVLKYDLSYVGMIGSRRRVRGMMDELLAEGFEKNKLDSVNSPIGLDIGAITPDEIAISIIAQLISFRNKPTVEKHGKDITIPEFDIEVVEKISRETEVPRALLTILSSKGSVPRKAGAKMIAYLDGRTVGSIGGGCSEAAVITKARDIMHSKGFFIEQIDMTGDVAESEGMVCGGVMEVLIEAF